jgi:hypothetical protein
MEMPGQLVGKIVDDAVQLGTGALSNGESATSNGKHVVRAMVPTPTYGSSKI